MNTKLTIRLDEGLIRKAKQYARKSGKSLSRMVADYFSLLTSKPKSSSDLSPVVKQLKGVLKGSRVSEREYERYLEDKYR